MKPIIALLTSLVCGLAVSADEPRPGPVVVPFDLLTSRHMVVQIKVNGKGPYRVIFDTGAPVILLNTRVGKESGLLGGKNAAPMFSTFGNIGQVKIKTLEFGSAKVRNIPAIVMDHPTVEMISKLLGRVEGIVGFPFFARFKTTIDYQAKELTFEPNGFEPPDTLQALIGSVMAIGDDRPAKAKVLAPGAQWGLVLGKETGDDEPGMTIKQVFADSPAFAAGLKTGDRLLTLDGRWTDTVADAYRAASFVKPGQAVKVGIRRDGAELELTVKPRPGV